MYLHVDPYYIALQKLKATCMYVCAVLTLYLVIIYSHNIWLGNKRVAVHFGGLVILFKLKHEISAEFIPVNQAIRCDINLQYTMWCNKIGTKHSDKLKGAQGITCSTWGVYKTWTLVHGPTLWPGPETGSLKIWTRSMDPLFLLPLKILLVNNNN